jgi:hypothetical protein
MPHTLPDKSLGGVNTGSVQVKFADGSERVVPVHGINQMRFLAILDEFEIKNFDELKGPEPTLPMIRVIQRVAAEALTSQDKKDPWTVERIQESFPDMIEVTKIFMACFNISNLPKGDKTVTSTRKMTLYH